MNPLVSIIIPIYNRVHLIRETLDSILAQTYTHWECIVVDDGSSDNTSEILNGYIKSDARFQYHHRPENKTKGANACRNYGFKISKGEFIHWFDSDDLMIAEHLEKKVEVLNNNPKIDYCVCRTQKFSNSFSRDNLSSISKNNLTNNLYEDYILGRFSILMISPTWRRSVFEKNQLFDEKLQQSQDLDIYSRLIFENNKMFYLPEVLIYVRRDNDSITTENNHLNIHTESFLEVKRRIINRTPKNKAIKDFNIKLVLWLFRYKLVGKKYLDSEKCLKFVFDQTKSESIFYRFYIFRISFFYKIFKYLKRGDTKFKFLLRQ